MVQIDIIPSTSAHVRELSKTIREADKAEAVAAGLVPHRALFYSFKHAFLRRTAFINGEVAAMFGVVGTPLGVLGQPYLVTSNLVEDIPPITFARIYKQEVQIMKKYFSLLENYVDDRYDGAKRMLEIAGFSLSEPIKTRQGFTFRKFSLRGDV